MLTDHQRRALVEVARRAIVSAVASAVAPDVTPPVTPDATGAFVTIRRRGELRGCIGTLQCRAALADEVARCAVSAAREDPRFAPVRADELADLDVEVSVLGPLERIDASDVRAIEVGRHGLVAQLGAQRGVLLPQVATEWGWNAETFLAQTCRKAGLPPDAWRHGAAIYRFEADVFGD